MTTLQMDSVIIKDKRGDIGKTILMLDFSPCNSLKGLPMGYSIICICFILKAFKLEHHGGEAPQQSPWSQVSCLSNNCGINLIGIVFLFV